MKPHMTMQMSPKLTTTQENSLLHALLQLPLFADLRKLFFVILPHFALFGSAAWVILNALNFLLPGFH